MTCIIGYKDTINDVVFIGADSLGSNNSTKTVRNDPKFFYFTKNIVCGFTTSYRMGQLIMYSKDLFEGFDKKNFTHENMVTKFIPRLIQLYKNNKDDEIDKKGQFIIGAYNKLWGIGSDFQVAESSDDFIACGSGEQFALGSLYSTKEMNISIIEKITLALESAEKFSCHVQRPFHIIHTNYETL